VNFCVQDIASVFQLYEGQQCEGVEVEEHLERY
jgi:hypothetical protein